MSGFLIIVMAWHNGPENPSLIIQAPILGPRCSWKIAMFIPSYIMTQTILWDSEVPFFTIVTVSQFNRSYGFGADWGQDFRRLRLRDRVSLVKSVGWGYAGGAFAIHPSHSLHAFRAGLSNGSTGSVGDGMRAYQSPCAFTHGQKGLIQS